MKVTKYILAFLISLAACVHVSAQSTPLKFNKNGKLKIVQFTDMHLVLGQSEYRDAQVDRTFSRLSNVIKKECPDMLMFTGDVVTEGTASRSWNRLLDSLNMYKIPFCVVFGNHDPENELTKAQMSELITSSPYSLNELDRKGELADMEIEVLASKGVKTAFALYCLDSHDYSTVEGVGGYGWFERSQVQWVMDSCQAMTEKNSGRPVPSMAFFHICLQEFATAWNDTRNTKIGRKAENECPGALNTGMFAAMVETGSVMGVFVGHDHDNDYVVAEKGIALGYGRYSGSDTTYNNLRPGARVIEVYEGQRAFESWIIEDDGRVVDHMMFKDGKIKSI